MLSIVFLTGVILQNVLSSPCWMGLQHRVRCAPNYCYPAELLAILVWCFLCYSVNTLLAFVAGFTLHNVLLSMFPCTECPLIQWYPFNGVTTKNYLLTVTELPQSYLLLVLSCRISCNTYIPNYPAERLPFCLRCHSCYRVTTSYLFTNLMLSCYHNLCYSGEYLITHVTVVQSNLFL